MDFLYLVRRLPKTMVFAILVTMLIASLDGIVISTVISKVTKFQSGTPLMELVVFSSISLISYIVVLTSNYASVLVRSKMLKTISISLKQEYMEKVMLTSNYSQDTDKISSFLLNDFKLFESNYVNVMLDIVSSVLMGVISMVYLLYLNPIVACLFIVFSFLPMLPAKLLSHRVEEVSKEWSISNEKFTGTIKNIFFGRKTIKTYSAYPFAFRRLNKDLTNVETQNEQLRNTQSFVNFWASVFSWISYIVPITVALYFVIEGKLEAGAVVAMFLASDRVIYPLRSASMLVNQMNTTKEVRAKIYEVVSSNPQTKPVSIYTHPTLKIDNVSFGYNEETPLFSSVSMEIPYGEKLLISGASGTGKTTFLDLLQGVVEPNTGNISVVTTDGKQEDTSFYMSRINQEPIMFESTIRDNIALGKEFSDSDIMNILDTVGLVNELGEEILDKPYLEASNALSGGQKQRIEIARAILHQKAILLVDEATSALDKENSNKIRALLSKLPCTVIEVAHHFTQEDIEKNNLKHIRVVNGDIK